MVGFIFRVSKLVPKEIKGSSDVNLTGHGVWLLNFPSNKSLCLQWQVCKPAVTSALLISTLFMWELCFFTIVNFFHITPFCIQNYGFWRDFFMEFLLPPLLSVSTINPMHLSKVPALLCVMSVRKKIGTMFSFVVYPFCNSISSALGVQRLGFYERFDWSFQRSFCWHCW